MPIPSFSSSAPALSLGFGAGVRPPEPRPEPAAAPLQPGPAGSSASPSAPLPASEPGAVAPTSVPPVPTVATTIDLPGRPELLAQDDAGAADSAGEGGEWALLLSKVQAWLASGQLQAQWQAARTPLALVAGLLGLVVVLQIYGALLGVIDRFPLAPGLLELVGLITVVRFGLTRLVRSQERRALIAGLKQRWTAFRGQG